VCSKEKRRVDDENMNAIDRVQASGKLRPFKITDI
jgi:hypothetical protein